MQTPGLYRMQEMKRERQNEQMVIYLFVLSMYLLTFWIGLLGFSLFWVFVIAFITFFMWKRKVFSLTERHIKEREIMLYRKRALRQSESCEWLNFIINRWLVFCTNTLSDVLKRKFDPVLQQLLPYFLSYLELKRINVGSKTPFIRSIQAFEVDEGNRRPVSWDNVAVPPVGLRTVQKYQVVVIGKIEIMADEFMELTARLSGRWMGLSLDISIEKLEMKANLQMVFHLDMDTPFPHISSISVLLVEKPDISFSIRVLRHIQLMEIPLLKLWIHGMVTNILTDAFVDPGKLEFNLAQKGPIGCIPSQHPMMKLAHGVLTVSLSGSYKAGERKRSRQATNPIDLLGDTRCCVISMDGQEFLSSPISGSTPFNHSATFLVHSPSEDKVKVSLNSKTFLTSLSLTSLDISLSKYPLDLKQTFEEVKDCMLERTNESLRFSIKLEYSPLPSWDSLIHGVAPTTPDELKWTKSGIINVCIHGASDLMGLDPDGLSDPYCIVYNNGKKMVNTHYVPHTRNPRWEVFTQFIVDDISRVVLSFVVYDWDGRDTNDDDFLGSAHIIMTQDQPKITYQTFPLNTSFLPGGEAPVSRGILIISVIFVPIKNISLPSREISFDQVSHQGSLWASDPHLKYDSRTALLTPQGMIKVDIIQASNLVAKDRNGLSDPFCEVHIGRNRKYVTSVKKKTLNPVWNEQCVIELPKEDETLDVLLWDHDRLSKNDFLGSLNLSRKKLIELGGDAQHDGWFKLEKVQTGRIQVKFQIFAQDSLDDPPPPLELNIIGASDDHLHCNADDVIHEVTKEGAPEGTSAVDLRNDKDDSSPQLNGELGLISSHESLNNGEKFGNRFQKRLERAFAFISHRRLYSNRDLRASDYKLYVGIRIEVTCIEGSFTSKSQHYCRVKLYSAIDHENRTIAKSTKFVPADRVPMDLAFNVDQAHGECKWSSLTFSIKSNSFHTYKKGTFYLGEIVPTETRKKHSKELNLGGIKLHLTCSFQENQVGCKVLQSNPKLKERI